ncbi:MAG: putative Ig domain-containing protein [Acidobacteriota bacterium]
MRITTNQLRRNRLWIIAGGSALLVVLLAAGVWRWRQGTALTAQASAPLRFSGEAAVAQLKQDGSYNSLVAAMSAARYQITPDGEQWAAENPVQRFNTSFNRAGVRLAHASVEAPEKNSARSQWAFGLQLTRLGHGETLSAVGDGETITHGDRIEIRKPGITEWYVNKPEGLEQGFTIHERQVSDQPLRLALQVSGDLRPELSAHKQAIILKDRAGRARLSYDKLAAWDADGKQLPATMTVKEQEITLTVDERAARYPVTIDPMIAQQQKLTAADGAAQDKLGSSVSLKGNSAIAGAPGDNSGKGSAYVFAFNGSSWTQAKLQAPDGSTGDSFGWSVAIDGTTAVVGAPYDDSQRGSVYVFVYGGGIWSFQARLTASDSTVADGDRFGWSVSLSGNSVIVGAYQDDGNAGQNQGAAFVFTRTGTTWTQQQKLVSADAAAGDQFGRSVTINGDNAVVTADQDDIGANTDQGSAYVFKRNGATWSQQKKLTASSGAANDRFGSSVAISGVTIIVGSATDDDNANNLSDCGSAYVYYFTGQDWVENAKLTAADRAANDYFGFSVDISGDLAVIGAYGKNGFQGAAYVFAQVGVVWSQQQKLSPADSAAGDWFGASVSVDGNTMVGGASVGGDVNQGAAYVYAVCADIAQMQKLSGDGVAADLEYLGGAIAVSGDTAAVGGHGWQNFRGIVRIYTRAADNSWNYVQSLAPAVGTRGTFGGSLALDGNTLVVGAPSDNFLGLTYSGSVYVYTRTGNTWAEDAHFQAFDTQTEDYFGQAVALSGNTMLVGVPRDDTGQNLDQGSVYVYVKNSGGQWTQQGGKLTGSSPNADDFFGVSVALEGDRALVGVSGASLFGIQKRGLVQPFKRSNGVWNAQGFLLASDGAAGDRFGAGIAMQGNTAMIGATGASAHGAAYVFGFDGVAWLFKQKLLAPAGSGDDFGGEIGLAGDTAVLGTAEADVNGNNYQGTAFVYKRSAQGTWSLQKQLFAANGAAYDRFGSAVAVSNEMVLVGATNVQVGTVDNRGAVYVFGCATCPVITITTGALPNGSVGNAYNLTLAASGGSGNFQFSLSGGSLPTGLTLAQNGKISGTATAAGTYNFTVTATTPELCTGSKNYAITINGGCPSFTLNPATLPDGTVGSAYNQTLTPTGGTAPFLFNVSGALPPGVQLNSQTGTLLGVPNAPGTYHFTVTAIGANFCQGAQTYDVTINPAGGNLSGLQYYPLPKPVRLLDTRAGQGNCDNVGQPIFAGSAISKQARTTCEGVLIPNNAQAVVGNITVLNQAAQPGYLTLYPTGMPAPLAANLIYQPNQVLANAFTVGLSANGEFDIFGERDIHVVVDISGYYAPPAAGGLYYHPLPKPVRLLDTRAGQGNCDNVNAPLAAGTSLTKQARITCEGVTIPAAAQALAGNATVINQSAQAGYLTLYPTGVAAPLAANLIYQPGQVLANAFTVSLSGNGEFNIYGERTIELIVDVAGYYSTEANDVNGAGLLFTPLALPVRLLDTRAGQGGCDTVGAPITAGTSLSKLGRMSCDGQLIPNNAQALTGNVTVINLTGQTGYLTLYPTGVAAPLAANLIYGPSGILSNAFVVGLGANGEFSLFAERTLEAIVDVSGFFAP